MRRLMNFLIVAALGLIFTFGWYVWSRSQIHLVQTWSIGRELFALSSNGKFLATPGGPYERRKIDIVNRTETTTVKLYTFPDEELVRTFQAFYVIKLAFSPDSSLMAAGTGLGEIFIWRTDSGQLLHSLKASMIIPGRENVRSLAFSPDGETLVSVAGGQVDVWRVADGQLRYSLSHEYNCYAAISPDGQILAISKYPITLYRLSDGTLLRQLELEVYGNPKFSPDGQLLAIYSSKGYKQYRRQKLLLYRLEDDTLLGPLVVSFDGSLRDFAFSRDSRYLAATYGTGGPGGDFFVFPNITAFLAPPVRYHLLLWHLDSLLPEGSKPQVRHTQKKPLTTLAFSSDGKILVSGGDRIRLWRMPS